jgi:hypothetical protein
MNAKYMIVEDVFKNVVNDKGNTCGFEVGFRIPYYRGIMISCMEDYKITVDGEEFTKDKMKVWVGGSSFTYDQLQSAVYKRCEFGEVAKFIVEKEGGLAAGEHEVVFDLEMRISYMPWPSINRDCKKLTLLV